MKLRVTMKSPNALEAALNEASFVEFCDVKDAEERMALREEWENERKDVCSKWFRYQETIQLEIDFSNDTIKVLEQ